MSKRKSSVLKQVQQRRKDVAALIEKLWNEDIELATTERVLERLSAAACEDETESETPLEEHSPTIGDRILETLNDLDLIYDEMTAGQILDYIREKWMPNLIRTSFSPPLFRLCRDKKLIKTGKFYSLPKTNKAPITGASQVATEGDTSEIANQTSQGIFG